MRIIEKKTGELHPYERNPRNNDGAVDAVAASIKEFGFKVPVVIDTDDMIVAGHTRVKAAKKLRAEKPRTKVTLSERERELINSLNESYTTEGGS